MNDPLDISDRFKDRGLDKVYGPDDDIPCFNCGKIIVDEETDLFHISGWVDGKLYGHLHACYICAKPYFIKRGNSMDLMELLLDQLLSQAQQELTKLDAIEGFMDFEKVPVPEELMTSIYTPVEVVTHGINYYFVKDQRIVYLGFIDKEGLMGTIEKDVTTLPDLLNFMIALRTDDREKVKELMGSLDKAQALFEQMLAGQQSYQENHGDKPQEVK